MVEILSCIAIHPVLNRVGRKPPYFIAAFCFALVALAAVVTQYATVKNSLSKIDSISIKFNVLSQRSKSDYICSECFIEIFRFW